MTNQLWAHSRNDKGERHTLRDHLISTGELAARFAEPFGAAPLARALGLFHDAGKASCSWQEALLAVEGQNRRTGVPHKEFGAVALRGPAHVAALAVLGHHVPENWRRRQSTAEVGIRLVFSALVDADRLDTGAHRAGTEPTVRPAPDMEQLWKRYDQERVNVLAKRAASGKRADPVVDAAREQVYQYAVRAAERPGGLFRLAAPTGSAKTMAAGAFALRHAALHGKSRVIVAVPFTTITEQNAGQYRELLDADRVLEHHSSVDLDTAPRWYRPAAENWDADFIVTTTVQLFDSLFGRKPERSRKLHRLANSVIVLDEVQALPLSLLTPILDVLRVLAEEFGTTVVLSSATQPAFQSLPVWKDFPVTDIVPDPTRLFDDLRRVRYEWWCDPRPTLAEVAEAALDERQCLVVVNTTGNARTVYRHANPDDETSPHVLHLSARMCGAHRQQVLHEANRRLNANEPVLLVSTQLIEAGVDIDFPVVYRVLAGADAVQQAAGRANREGVLGREGGRVVIVVPEDGGYPGAEYRALAEQTSVHFWAGQDPDRLDALDRYYRGVYSALNLTENRRANAVQRGRAAFDYQSVAEGPLLDAGGAGTARDRALAFRMIDEDTVPVVVDFHGKDKDHKGEGPRLVERLRSSTNPTPQDFRAVQPYVVPLPRALLNRPDIQAICRPVVGDLHEWAGDYHEAYGIDTTDIVQEEVW
ncbi:CRISPR-associated helicase/endonuclease Cas3 [Actinoalloteichus spitiensis]|uniref:CRISPR-associated helicase/endonuclease Cas3 n=1 Tax=Actinoalloteichus spitiensis TaxID=252394 RepID=UPI00036C5E6F|nr:CRISPR-associated helicase/endonuclease Cas3 [Actinoalloteichus spitiensis]